MITLIDAALLDEIGAQAKASPRLRRNRNFHARDDHPAHRLLNAIEPGSYVAPHRHLDATKDETMLVLRGRLGLVLFDDAGGIARAVALSSEDGALGVDIAHGTWHSVLALAPGTVFFEAKAGPYVPLLPEERAAFSPAESAPDAAAYLARLRDLFDR